MRSVLPVACALLLLYACESGRSGTVQNVTSVLRVGQSDEAAQCEAALLHESELSDAGVVEVAFGVGSNTAMDDDFELDEIAADLSGDDRDAFRKIAAEFAACMD